MRLAFPERPIRRADLAVGASLWLWNLGQLAGNPWLAAMHPRMLRDDLYRKIAAFLVLDLLLWSVAGLGVARGRRWDSRRRRFSSPWTFSARPRASWSV